MPARRSAVVASPGYTKGESASRLPSGYSPAGLLTGGCEGEDGVDGGLERPCVALDLGQQEAALQGGEQHRTFPLWSINPLLES